MIDWKDLLDWCGAQHRGRYRIVYRNVALPAGFVIGVYEEGGHGMKPLRQKLIKKLAEDALDVGSCLASVKTRFA